jgi:hypothetical protein
LPALRQALADLPGEAARIAGRFARRRNKLGSSGDLRVSPEHRLCLGEIVSIRRGLNAVCGQKAGGEIQGLAPTGLAARPFTTPVLAIGNDCKTVARGCGLLVENFEPRDTLRQTQACCYRGSDRYKVNPGLDEPDVLALPRQPGNIRTDMAEIGNANPGDHQEHNDEP